jgi:multidrug efflux pump
MVFAIVPPAVPELGTSSGFDFQLQDIGGVGHEALVAARNQVLGMAAQDPNLAGVRPNGQDDTPQLKIDIDQAKAGAMGLTTADINAALSAAWGGATSTTSSIAAASRRSSSRPTRPIACVRKT